MINTNNPSNGFYGTVHGNKNVAWKEAMKQLQNETGLDQQDIATFLDSTCGRHFADQVNDSLAAGNKISYAIADAIMIHQGYSFSREQRKEWNIARNIPTYLHGLISAAVAFA